MRYIDSRTEPVDYKAFRIEAHATHSRAYRAGTMSEAVYRASLHALGWRGDDLRVECAMNAPDPKPVPREKYKVVGGTVVKN